MVSVINETTIVIGAGDTGILRIEPVGCTLTANDRVVFCMCSKDTSRVFLRKIIVPSDGAAIINFTNADTENLPRGSYYWDVRIVKTPVWNEGETDIIGGAEIHSPFAESGLPTFIVREVGASV